jgi:hypothetical protein
MRLRNRPKQTTGDFGSDRAYRSKVIAALDRMNTVQVVYSSPNWSRSKPGGAMGKTQCHPFQGLLPMDLVA